MLNITSILFNIFIIFLETFFSTHELFRSVWHTIQVFGGFPVIFFVIDFQFDSILIREHALYDLKFF